MASTVLTGKVAVIGGGAKNLGGLISRTFGADGAAAVPGAAGALDGQRVGWANGGHRWVNLG